VTLPVRIEGHAHPSSTVTPARVTRTGQLVVAPFAYDETKFNVLDVAGTAVNFFTSKADSQFVITGVIATGDLQIAANAVAEVVILEGDNETDATGTKTLIQFGITRLQSVSYLPLNLLVTEGKFVNAKTDDDDVHMTIMGYFIPALT